MFFYNEIKLGTHNSLGSEDNIVSVVLDIYTIKLTYLLPIDHGVREAGDRERIYNLS